MIPVTWIVAGAVGLGALGVFGYQKWQIVDLRSDVAKVTSERDTERASRLADRAAADKAALAQAEDFRRRELGWQARIVSSEEKARAESESLRIAVAAGERTAGRLRDRVAALAAAARRPAPGASAPAGGPTADEAVGMLADLCGRADARSGVLAHYADALRISAESCLAAWPVSEK